MSFIMYMYMYMYMYDVLIIPGFSPGFHEGVWRGPRLLFLRMRTYIVRESVYLSKHAQK